MNNLVLYTKSYSGDLERLKVSIESIKQFNKDSIPYYVSVPAIELSLFKNSVDTSYVNLVVDEEIFPSSEKESWVKQQIVKSSFWKLGVCENYLMLDSDSYFIRDFTVADFMYDQETPYTVMHEQKDLFSWTSRFGMSVLGFNPKQSFLSDRAKIMEVLGRTGKVYDFGPGPIIWSKKVWQGLEDNYIAPNNLTFSDLIKYCQSEFSWYGEYLLTSKAIELIPIEPLFKFFHYKQQYEYFKQQGYTEDSFKENYLGLVMQSNWNAPLKF